MMHTDKHTARHRGAPGVDEAMGRNEAAGDEAVANARPTAPGHDARNRRLVAGCLATSALQMFSTMTFNGSLNDAYAAYADTARDWATLAGTLTLLALLALARRSPQSLRPVRMCVGAGALGVVGGLTSCVGLALGSAALITLGLCVKNVGGAWVSVLWIVACSSLGLAEACLTIALGNCAGILLSLVLAPLRPVVLVGLADSLGMIVSLCLCLPLARPFFERLSRTDSLADQEVAHPAAFLPLRSHLFLYIFAFNFAYGYGFRFLEGGSVPVQNALAVLALLAVCAYVGLSRRHPRLDSLFLLPFALVLTGYLAALSGTGQLAAAAPSLLVAGSASFELLTWFALCSATKRNVIDALPTVAWGLAVSYVGIDLGALLAMATGTAAGAQGMAAQLAIVVVLVAFVLYVVCTRRTFSFDETIEGIAPDAPAMQAVEVRDVDVLEARVARVAEECALTPRERDVMAQLARGNNARHIEETLSISHNTVKYHARNVYAKLGVHSQQELIDLVAQR